MKSKFDFFIFGLDLILENLAFKYHPNIHSSFLSATIAPIFPKNKKMFVTNLEGVFLANAQELEMN